MPTDDQTLEGDASGGAEDTELELEGTSEGGDSKELSDDPLDKLQDVEEIRAEAKKFRSISQRLEKKPEIKKEAPIATDKYLTKDDFFKSNERKAIREITADAEIKANWNEIIPFYTPRRGKETPEDIKEDILDAITLYKARNPEVVTDDSKNELTATPVVKTGGGTVDKATKKTPEPTNFSLPIQPKDWYPKKG